PDVRICGYGQRPPWCVPGAAMVPRTTRARSFAGLSGARGRNVVRAGEAVDEACQVGAEFRAQVAAFLDQQRRQVQGAERGADAAEAVRRDRQAPERVAGEGVEAERDNEDVGVEGGDPRQADL